MDKPSGIWAACFVSTVISALILFAIFGICTKYDKLPDTNKQFPVERFSFGPGQRYMSKGCITSTIIVDTTAPTGTVQINGGATITNKTAATITLSGTDANGITQMRFSKDGGITYVTGWETYATTRGFTLLANGSVTVQYKDTAGNLSAPITSTIIVDTTAPTGTILINGGAATATSTAATLTLSAADLNVHHHRCSLVKTVVLSGMDGKLILLPET